jgi:hypothetical protein
MSSLALSVYLAGASGCRGILGIDPERDVSPADALEPEAAEGDTAPVAPDAANADALAETDLEEIDGAASDAVDATDDTAAAGDALDAGDAETALVDRQWAAWPLPPASPPLTQYEVVDDGVHDKLTGLVWQRVGSRDLAFAEIEEYCPRVDTGGAKDWRLPTWIELLSIVDFGAAEPALPSVFASSRHARWWSSTQDPTPWQGQLVVNQLGMVVRETIARPPLTSVRCVRGAPFFHDRSPGAPKGRYVRTAATARDTTTGLLWARDSLPGTASFVAARDACAALSLEGRSGFRLPGVRELLTILDVDETEAPHWDRSTFGPAAPTREFWTATPAAFSAGARWVVDIAQFETRAKIESASLAVRCVAD